MGRRSILRDRDGILGGVLIGEQTMIHDHGYASRREFLKPQMKWETKLAICIFIAVLILALFSGWANAETYATTQSKNPWTIKQCDKVMGQRVRAVMNVSIWTTGGFPLWRVLCVSTPSQSKPR